MSITPEMAEKALGNAQMFLNQAKYMQDTLLSLKKMCLMNPELIPENLRWKTTHLYALEISERAIAQFQAAITDSIHTPENLFSQKNISRMTSGVQKMCIVNLLAGPKCPPGPDEGPYDPL